jgi:hypothetical protein
MKFVRLGPCRVCLPGRSVVYRRRPPAYCMIVLAFLVVVVVVVVVVVIGPVDLVARTTSMAIVNLAAGGTPAGRSIACTVFMQKATDGVRACVRACATRARAVDPGAVHTQLQRRREASTRLNCSIRIAV